MAPLNKVAIWISNCYTFRANRNVKAVTVKVMKKKRMVSKTVSLIKQKILLARRPKGWVSTVNVKYRRIAVVATVQSVVRRKRE
jgi:hypothetical protein